MMFMKVYNTEMNLLCVGLFINSQNESLKTWHLESYSCPHDVGEWVQNTQFLMVHLKKVTQCSWGMEVMCGFFTKVCNTEMNLLYVGLFITSQNESLKT